MGFLSYGATVFVGAKFFIYLGVKMHINFMIYGIMIIKLIMAIVAAVVFMRIFTPSGTLKNMTPLAVIINFLLSAILSEFILNKNINISEFIIVILIYGILISILNRFAFYTDVGHRIFIGDPMVIIQNGQIDVKKMEKLKISARDLAVAMRQHKVHSLREIEMAQIEPNGELTIVKRGEKKYSVVVIDNGDIDESALQKINRSEKWLRAQLRKKRIRDIENIFVAQWHNGKLKIVKKDAGKK